MVPRDYVQWVANMNSERKVSASPSRRSRPVRVGLHVLAAGLVCLSQSAVGAPKTDVVTLVNGDRITGEIKELAYGQLKLKTDYLGTIYVQWNKVASIQTQQILQVELNDGKRYFGRIPEPGPGDATIALSTDGAPGTMLELRTTEVIRAAPLQERSWYQRLNGSFSIGYSYTQSSEVEQFNLGASVGSRNPGGKWRVAAESQITTQATGPNTQRATVTGAIERFRRNARFVQYSAEVTHNQELGLDLRTLAGIGYGRYLLQRDDIEWKTVAGITLQNEIRTTGQAVQSSEAAFNTEARLFRLDHPKRDISASITLLPSLTESGRVRGEASLRARQEFIDDLFLELSLYDSYDNKPPIGSPSNDWGLVTSLGFTF